MNMPCYFKHPCFAQRQIYSDVMGLMLQGPSFAQAPSKAWHVLQDSEKAAVLLLLNSEMAVLVIWVGPVGCQLYLLICTDLSDNLPLQSHWATEPCLWHSGEDLNCCRVAPPLLGDLYDSRSTWTSTPNQGLPGLPSGDRAPVRLSYVWTRSCRESCRKAMADNKVAKLKETSKIINNKTRFFSPIPEKRLNHLPSLSIENNIIILVKE